MEKLVRQAERNGILAAVPFAPLRQCLVDFCLGSGGAVCICPVFSQRVFDVGFVFVGLRFDFLVEKLRISNCY